MASLCEAELQREGELLEVKAHQPTKEVQQSAISLNNRPIPYLKQLAV